MVRRASSEPKKGSVPYSVTMEGWVVISIVLLTFWLVQSGTLGALAQASQGYGPLSGLVTGLLYSTFVTTPLAVAGFITLAETSIPVWQLAIAGALGATLVDLFLVKGLRSPLATMLMKAVVGHDIHAFRRKRGVTRWLAAVFGAFLIAIPLPTDELGLVFMGMSHLRALQVVPLIFIADFLGVYVMIAAAQSVL